MTSIHSSDQAASNHFVNRGCICCFPPERFYVLLKTEKYYISMEAKERSVDGQIIDKVWECAQPLMRKIAGIKGVESEESCKEIAQLVQDSQKLQSSLKNVTFHKRHVLSAKLINPDFFENCFSGCSGVEENDESKAEDSLVQVSNKVTFFKNCEQCLEDHNKCDFLKIDHIWNLKESNGV